MIETVPDELIGVWLRESISINGGEAFENSRVIWLQTPRRYADIRVPMDNCRGETEAAAGRQDWDDPRLTFHHELDHSGHYPIDIGALSWDGDTLIETGSVNVDGEDIEYLERWMRYSKHDPCYLALELRDKQTLQAIALRVEDHAVVITSANGISASYYQIVERRSIRRWAVGLESALKPPSLDLSHQHDCNYSAWQLVEQRL